MQWYFKYVKDEKLHIKFETSFNTTPLIIMMACCEELGRLDINFNDFITDKSLIYAVYVNFIQESVRFKATVTHNDPKVDLIFVEDTDLKVKPNTVKKLSKTEKGWVLKVDIV